MSVLVGGVVCVLVVAVDSKLRSCCFCCWSLGELVVVCLVVFFLVEDFFLAIGDSVFLVGDFGIFLTGITVGCFCWLGGGYGVRHGGVVLVL